MKLSIRSVGYGIATAALAPILLLQGKRVRKNTPVLPEPDGERSGLCGDGPNLRLLILGDSAAAGVGADHQKNALCGQLVGMLSTRYSLHWRLIAKSGIATADALAMLDKVADTHFDVVVTSLGVNDVTARTSPILWLSQQEQLVAMCREKFNAKLVIACGLPSMHAFPALPQPLRWFLGYRATMLNTVLRNMLIPRDDCQFLSLRFSDNVDLMASDGFHPGPLAYKAWATEVAALINKMFRSSKLK